MTCGIHEDCKRPCKRTKAALRAIADWPRDTNADNRRCANHTIHPGAPPLPRHKNQKIPTYFRAGVQA